MVRVFVRLNGKKKIVAGSAIFKQVSRVSPSKRSTYRTTNLRGSPICQVTAGINYAVQSVDDFFSSKSLPRNSTLIQFV